MKTIKFVIAMSAFAAAAGGALPALAACNNCGTVVDTKVIKKEGEASGGGAVLGGVAGGVIGHQIGQGRGNTAATVLGAAGGAYAGHQIEKSKNAKTEYQVHVKMEDGKTRYFTYGKETSFRVGDKVKVVDGKLVRE
jgi:outer membrane lipoprotein SlyB